MDRLRTCPCTTIVTGDVHGFPHRRHAETTRHSKVDISDGVLVVDTGRVRQLRVGPEEDGIGLARRVIGDGEDVGRALHPRKACAILEIGDGNIRFIRIRVVIDRDLLVLARIVEAPGHRSAIVVGIARGR